MVGKCVHTSFWQRSGSVPNNNIFEIDSYEIDSAEFLTHAHRAKPEKADAPGQRLAGLMQQIQRR